MPSADAVLLSLCVGLALIGVLVAAVAWRRGRKGRVVQGVALALAPVALYFSGLLRQAWNGVVAVGTWAGRVILSPTVWFGLSLLAVCVVLWVVGGIVARRTPKATKPAKVGSAGAPAVTAGQSSKSAKTAKTPKQAAPVDDDMADIEALLKSRGIS